jgi:hypothetical protein
VAATLSCQGSIDHVSVAAGTGTNGYVTLGATSGLQPSFFFDVGASAATVEQILPDASEIHMVSNGKGVLGVVETSRGSGTARWLTRTLPGGTPTWVSSSVTDIMWPSGSIEAALGPDGSQYAAFSISPNMDFALATRPPGGSAFSTVTLAPAGTVGQNVLGVDANGAAHLMYWAAGQGLVDLQPGKALVTALASTSSTPPISMQGARPSGQGIAMAMSLADGVHVVRPRTDGAFDDIPIPATIPFSYTVPPGLIPCVSFGCPTVTQSGDFSRGGHALAQAGDGTLWLATVRDHVDRTATYERPTGPGDACQCWGNYGGNFAPKDDLSSSTLVIQRIPSGATAPSGILWSLDLGLRPWAYYSVTNETMSASFAGSLLFLAILAPDNDVHYLVIDTANLFGS